MAGNPIMYKGPAQPAMAGNPSMYKGPGQAQPPMSVKDKFAAMGFGTTNKGQAAAQSAMGVKGQAAAMGGNLGIQDAQA